MINALALIHRCKQIWTGDFLAARKVNPPSPLSRLKHAAHAGFKVFSPGASLSRFEYEPLPGMPPIRSSTVSVSGAASSPVVTQHSLISFEVSCSFRPCFLVPITVAIGRASARREPAVPERRPANRKGNFTRPGRSIPGYSDDRRTKGEYAIIAP